MKKAKWKQYAKNLEAQIEHLSQALHSAQLDLAIASLEPEDCPEQTNDIPMTFSEAINNEAFRDYAGLTVAQAKQLCIDNDLDFQDDFWQPFLRYQWIQEHSDELCIAFVETAADHEMDFDLEAEYTNAYNKYMAQQG